MYIRAKNTGSGGAINYATLLNDVSGSGFKQSHTLTNASGKTVIAMMFSTGGGTSYDIRTFDGATVSDGSTITKIDTVRDTGAYVYGTFYQIDVKTNSCVISHSSNNYLKVIGPT